MHPEIQFRLIKDHHDDLRRETERARTVGVARRAREPHVDEHHGTVARLPLLRRLAARRVPA